MHDFRNGFQANALLKRSEEDRSITAANGVESAHSAAGFASHPGNLAACGVPGGTAAHNPLLNLQRRQGNRYVQRVVSLSLQAEGESAAPPDVQQAIESSRGGGRPLDGTVGAQMGQAFNADFSGVRVHTDGQADALNRSLNAKAFTTGKDVFFRHGEYNPGSSGGKQLLAHELTHVVQQNPDTVQRRDDERMPAAGCVCGGAGKLARSIQTQLTVGRPGDIYEQEADQMAQAFPAWEHQASQASDAGNSVRRAMPEEEKKETAVQTKPQEGMLWRQPEEEKKKEDMLRAKPEPGGLQRLGAEEDLE